MEAICSMYSEMLGQCLNRFWREVRNALAGVFRLAAKLYSAPVTAATELEANGTTVTLKGDAGQYTLANWTDGSYSYSLSLTDGLSLSDWQTLISSIQS